MLSAALLCAFGTASADDEEIARYSKPDSSISIGAGFWNKDRPQQGIYDGMRDNKAYGLIDADIAKRDDATGDWLLFKGQGLGLDSREFRIDVLRQGEIGGYVEYGRTTRDNPYKINTPLQGIGSTNLTVGSNLGTFPMREVELGTTRELWRLGGFKNLAPGLDLKVDFKNEEKNGTRQWGWGSEALFSVEPIDSRTQQFEASLQYAGEKLQLNGGYYGSWYNNHNLQVLEQINGATGGTTVSFSAVTPMSLPLDNQAHQVFVDGGYAFTPTTRGTFKVAYTHATQDEHIPSYDLTGINAPFNRAPSSLNGEVNTTLVQLGLTSRPMSKLSINANLRYFDVNDKTPVAGFVGSNATGVATVFNTPQSYTTTSGKLEATYRLPMNFSVTGGVDYSTQDRSYPKVGSVYVPFRTDVTETTYRVALRRSLADDLNGTLAYLYSERDGSSYKAANGTEPWSNQINPIHIADRSRSKVRAALDWEPMENTSVQFRADYSQDKYDTDGRPYGVRNGDAQLYAVDGSYALSDSWTLAAWYSYDKTKAREVGTRVATGTAATATKDSDLKDIGNSLGVSLRGKLTGQLEVGAGLDWFSNSSSYSQDLALSGAGTVFPAGITGPLPDIKNKLLRLKLDGKYAVDKASEIVVSLVHERWRTDDWSWENSNGSPFAYYSGAKTCNGCGLGAGAGVRDGTTVKADDSQSSTFVGVRYLYKFQ